MSSKGQLVIPAALRQQVGLKAGQAVAVRRSGDRDILLSPAEVASDTAHAMLLQARAWAPARRRDLVEELHRRRRHERERAAKTT